MFADVLGLDRVSVTTSFFDLGGNSLSAMRLAARTGGTGRHGIGARPVRRADGAGTGHRCRRCRRSARPDHPGRSAADHIPVSFAQQRMWFMNQFDPDAPTYNIQAGAKLTGDLDTDALRQAVLDVVERHEVLRTTFPGRRRRPHAGDPRPPVGRRTPRLGDRRLRGRSHGGCYPRVRRGRAECLRVRLLRSQQREWIFLAVLHHIVSDGESMGPLLTDIVTAYAARAQGHTPAFAPLPVQFADYAIWQHEVLGDPQDQDSVVGRQLEYWEDQLMGLPDVLELPADRPRPVTASAKGASIDFTVPRALGERIEQLAAEYGLTSFMVVHAALAVLLSRLTAADDIAIATPIAGRGDRVLDPMVGMFVNTLVLRSELEPMMAFSELLEEVRETDLDAFANADVPFEAVVDAVGAVRSQAFAPLAQVMLSVDHNPAAGAGAQQPVDVGSLTVEQIEPPTAFAQRICRSPCGPWRAGTGRPAWSTRPICSTGHDGDVRAAVPDSARLAHRRPDGAIGAAQFLVAQEHSSLVDWSSGRSTAPVRATEAVCRVSPIRG